MNQLDEFGRSQEEIARLNAIKAEEKAKLREQKMQDRIKKLEEALKN